MRQCTNANAASMHARLKKIIGQVQAVDRMIDEDIPCEDVLAQINACKSALHRVGQMVLEGHIQHCVRDSRTADSAMTPAPVRHFSRLRFPYAPPNVK